MDMIKFVLGCVISFTLMILIMPKFIKLLKKLNINQNVSEYALEEYKKKDKTPIIGGLMFVILPIISYAIINFNGLLDRELLFILLSFILYCSVGFIDDYIIVVKHNNDGLSPITRIVMETVYTTILFFIFKDILYLQVTIPFINTGITLPWFIYLPFMILVYEAEANAVNFTDGMDGLCAGVSFIALIAFLVLSIIYGKDNITLLLICIMAGLIGYLIFNFHPAKIFMGDSGSLALGGLFASLGFLYDKTIALFFIGGVFVIEMFCVVLQQLSVRLFKKRIFSYTPIHYAFSLKGYKEEKIVISFYLVQLLFTLIGLFIGIHTL